MYKDEGGDAAAWKACVNIVKTEIKLQREGKLLHGVHDWYKMNPMSKRVEWMHLEQSFTELFEQAWALKTVDSKVTNSAKPMATTPSTEQGTTTKQATTGHDVKDPAKDLIKVGKEDEKKDKGKRKPAKKKREAESDGGEGDDTAKRLKKEEQQMWTKFKNIKAGMAKVSAAANDLEHIVTTKPSWGWCNNEPMLKGLREVTRGALKPHLKL